MVQIFPPKVELNDYFRGFMLFKDILAPTKLKVSSYLHVISFKEFNDDGTFLKIESKFYLFTLKS